MNDLPATADVVVVGGGIIGLSTALELAKAGFKVCVVERGEAGRQCSWAGGGMLATLPPDEPAPEIVPLLQESLRLYPDYCARLAQDTGIDPEYWGCGAWLFRGATERWLPDLAQVRNPRLLKALKRALTQIGVSVVEDTNAIGWLAKGDRLDGVHTSRGSIACKFAVLAAGAWSSDLAPFAIKPVKGEMLLLRAKPGLLGHIRINEHAYLIPRRDGLILLGSTVENAGFDAAATPAARALLLQRLEFLWPAGKELKVEQHWAGLRPRPDGVAPVIAAANNMRGLFYNTGHFRLGITLALASARRITAMMIPASQEVERGP